MANRIVDGTYIIDTASGNTAIPLDGKFRVEAFAFWTSSANGLVSFAGNDTTNVIATLATVADETAHLYLGGQSYDTLKVPTLTAGTAWIYLR